MSYDKRADLCKGIFMRAFTELVAALVAGFLLASCTSDNIRWAGSGAAPAAAAKPTAPAAHIIRINFGRAEPYKDSAGNTWLGDAGMADGDIIDRGAEQAIKNTRDPDLFRTEHWGMSAFSWPLPNGKYLVKLYFAETSEHVGNPGERVFDINVQGREFKDFDVIAKAGGFATPYILDVPVAITDGKLAITFTVTTEQAEINALEIIPQN